MNKYRFSAEQDSLAEDSFDIDAPTLEQAVQVYGILYMAENPTTTDLWVRVRNNWKYTTPMQIRIKVQTKVIYTLEEFNPLTQVPNEYTKARGLEIGVLVAVSRGEKAGDIAGTVVGFDADGDPLVRDDQGTSSWLPRALIKAEVTK